MNVERLLKEYERIADAQDAVGRLRQFIRELAVRGKLVPQDAKDEAASELLKRIAVENAASSKTRGKTKFIVVASEDMVPYAAPSGWAWAKFGDIMVSRDGERIPVSREERNGRAKKYDYYGASGVIDKIDDYLFDKPLLLIGEDGANLVNRSTPIAFIARGKYWVNNYAHVLDGISEQFLLYVELFINAIDLKPYVTGTAQPKMNQAKMNSILVAVPPLAEQRRIVTKVDELMALCDQLEKSRTAREETRDRLTAASLARLNDPAPETFQTDARFALDALPSLTARPDQIKQLRQTILNLAVRGKLGQAAQGEFKAVGAYRSLQNGYAFKSEWFATKGMRLLRNANIGHGTIRWDDTVFLDSERVDEFKRFLLKESDIVLTLDRPFIVTGTKVARISVHDAPSLLLQRVGRFVETTPGLSNDYLFMWITSPDFNRQIDPGRSNGVPHISSKQVEAAKIFVPSLHEQQRIVAKVDELMALCDRLEASLAAGETARSRLLDALLTEALVPSVDQLEAAA